MAKQASMDGLELLGASSVITSFAVHPSILLALQMDRVSSGRTVVKQTTPKGHADKNRLMQKPNPLTTRCPYTSQRRPVALHTTDRRLPSVTGWSDRRRL